MPRFENPIEYPFVAEAAAALGHSGRQLKKALDALRKYDSDVGAGYRQGDQAVRSDLVAQAGEAFWGYVVQREVLGLMDPEYVGDEYGVPPEVWRAMGPRNSSSTS
jgi:hypothetical protein